MISFVICSYNGQDKVHKMLYSLLKTNHNFEVVVINDGSSDNTKSTVDLFNDHRIKYYEQVNSGLQIARLNGVKLSSFENIIFLDDDDTFNISDFFEEIKSIDISIYDLVVFNNIVINKRKEVKFSIVKKPLEEYVESFINVSPVSGSVVWNKIYKKTIILKILSDVSKFNAPAEDLPFNIFYNDYVKNIFYMKGYYYNYYINDNSITKTINEQKYEAYIQTLSFLLEKSPNTKKIKSLAAIYNARANKIQTYLDFYYFLILKVKNILRFILNKSKPCYFYLSFLPGLFKFNSYVKNVVVSREWQSLLTQGKSIIRFGDGEFRIMFNKGNIGFQDCDVNLSKKLSSVYQKCNHDVFVGVPNFADKKLKFPSYLTWCSLFNKFAIKDIKKLSTDNLCDSFMTRPYIDWDSSSTKIFDFWIEFFSHKKILIVCGYDNGLSTSKLLNNSTVETIKVPNRNCSFIIKEISNKINSRLESHDFDLMLISLGPSATILCNDFSPIIQSVDIGHLDIEYEWFLINATKKVRVEGHTCGEV